MSLPICFSSPCAHPHNPPQFDFTWSFFPYISNCIPIFRMLLLHMSRASITSSVYLPWKCQIPYALCICNSFFSTSSITILPYAIPCFLVFSKSAIDLRRSSNIKSHCMWDFHLYDCAIQVTFDPTICPSLDPLPILPCAPESKKRPVCSLGIKWCNYIMYFLISRICLRFAALSHNSHLQTSCN